MSQDNDGASAIAVMSAVLSQALDRVEAMPGSPAKTAAIRRLAEVIGKFDIRVTEMRRAEVLRIRDEEQLALAPLADRVGMSKARAGQIVKAEEQRQKEASDA